MSKQWNESTKVNTQKTHYDAFMRANRMSINRLYEKIKKDIRAVKKLEGGQAEHLDSCNILVEEGEDILSANAGD